MIMEPMAVGWYTPETWARLCEVVADPEKLAVDYDDFLKHAAKLIKAFEESGISVRKVLVDPDHMAAWCKRQGIVLDSSARAAYGAALAAAEGDVKRLDEGKFEDRTGELTRRQ